MAVPPVFVSFSTIGIRLCVLFHRAAAGEHPNAFVVRSQARAAGREKGSCAYGAEAVKLIRALWPHRRKALIETAR